MTILTLFNLHEGLCKHIKTKQKYELNRNSAFAGSYQVLKNYKRATDENTTIPFVFMYIGRIRILGVFCQAYILDFCHSLRS